MSKRLPAIIFALYLLILSIILLRINLQSVAFPFPFFNLVKKDGLAKILEQNTNLVPFFSIRLYVRAFQNGTLSNWDILANLAGNILLFVPMGVFLPSLFKKMRRWLPLLGLMILILVGVEVSQLLLMTGRLDIDDIILNLTGALLGFFFWHLWWGVRHHFGN